MCLDELQELGKVELGHDDKSSANPQATKKDGVEGVDMEHGKHTHQRIFNIDVEVGCFAIHLLGDAGDQTLVCEHHTLGQTGGAR